MTDPLVINRELDLRQPEDVEALITIASNQHYDFQMPLDDLKKGLDLLGQFFTRAQWLKLSPYIGDNLIIPTGKKSSRNFTVTRAAQLGMQIDSLKDCYGFADFLIGFTNPPQFFDSVFEANIASFCLPRVNELKLYPEYNVRDRVKHPDFELTSNSGIIVCECKSASSAEYQFVKKFDRLYSAIDKAIKDSGIVTNDLRLEVRVYQKIERDVNLLGREIAGIALGLREANLTEVLDLEPYQISLIQRDSPLLFNDRGIHRMSITLGDRPVQATAENAYLHITAGPIIQHLVRATGNLIRDAKSQLPESEMCLIFIETGDSDSARRAANRRIGIPDYDHVLACGISSPDGLQFVHRTNRQQNIEELFGPFANSETLT